MKAPRSLSVRLVVYLLIVQIIAIFSAPIAPTVMAISGRSTQNESASNDFAETLARDLLIESLEFATDGAGVIEPTPAFREYIDNNPSFRFAAYDPVTRVAYLGSSPVLIDAPNTDARFLARTIKFHVAGDVNDNAVGVLRKSATPSGPVITAVYGYVFRWNDLYYHFMRQIFTTTAGLLFAPIVLAAMAIAWFVVRRGLAPLRVAADEISRISMNSLHQRIPEANFPSEVRPFVDAVNQALARLDVGVAMQKRFIANAAHELRTPITILCARIDNPDEDTFRQDIKRDARRVRTVVEQLLVAARMSNHASALGRDIDVGKMVLTMVLDYMPLAIENRRKIELETPPVPVIVRGNLRALESVVANLIDNAIRAEPEGGAVLVRILPDATIEIVDHGEGVALDDREKIFEAFWRKSDSTPGAGLGLAITKEIIESHGGTISVVDTPGGGATFRVSLEQIAVVSEVSMSIGERSRI